MLAKALVELARRAGGPLPEAQREVTAAASRALGVERASVWFFTEDRSAIVCADLFELTPGRHSEGTRLTAVDFPAYFAALESNRSIDADDARTDPRTREFREGYLLPLGITSMLDAAVREEGRVVGVVCLEHVGPGRVWTAEEKAFAGSLADCVTIAREADRRRGLEAQLIQSQKMEAIGRMAGGISHDFNNLLMIILGNAELLARNGGAAPDRLREITDACNRGAALVKQLLILSRGQRVELQVVDFNKVIGGVGHLLKRAIGEDIDLEVRLEAVPGLVVADQAQLEQVLTNLAVNARDAMPGGGRLTIRTAGVGDRVLLEVSDTGTGIPAEIRGRIFEPFFTTKEPGKGTGLGLSTCYAIVHRLGGRLEVGDAPGGGTCFRVLLPRASASADDAPVAPEVGLPGGQETLLLVEDDPPVRRALADNLARLGYTVLQAPDGREALAASYDRIDLMVTDVVMPRMGGVELARKMRERRPGLKVLFISGWLPEDLEPGAAFLQKPVLIEELARWVRRLLEGSAQDRGAQDRKTG